MVIRRFKSAQIEIVIGGIAELIAAATITTSNALHLAHNADKEGLGTESERLAMVADAKVQEEYLERLELAEDAMQQALRAVPPKVGRLKRLRMLRPELSSDDVAAMVV